MDPKWHLEELLFRGRPEGSDLPTTYQVTLQERMTLPDGRVSILGERICTPEQAAEAGFPQDEIRAWIDGGLSSELGTARSAIAALAAERDGLAADLARMTLERDGLKENLEGLAAKITEERAIFKAAHLEAVAKAAQEKAAADAKAAQDQALEAARKVAAERAEG